MRPIGLLFLITLVVGAASCERNRDQLHQDAKTGLQESQAPKGAPPGQGRDVPSTTRANPNPGTLPDAGRTTAPSGAQK